jgi:hypothetical protein
MLYTQARGGNNMAKLIDNLTVSPANNVLLFNDEIAIANYDPTKLNALVIVAGSKRYTYSMAALCAIPESNCVFNTSRGDSIELLSFSTKQLF